MSVPSIFSQLHEQAEAFSNTIFNPPFANPRMASKEERLVSHCLDLFELIFLRGAEIYVAHINQGDIQQLSQSSNPKHQLLASIIEEDLQHPCLRNIADWYLFSWNDILLGGTSSMTIVYSSPNIEHEFAQPDIVLKGTCENVLFKDIVPLYKRGHPFKEFMYEYNASYPLPTYLRDYINRSAQIDHDVPQLAPIQMENQYDRLEDSYGNPIYVDGVPILHTPIRVEESDYIIFPHKNVNGKLPLVLSELGLSRARYVLGMQWYPHFYRIPQDIMHIPLEDRILPGTSIKYPYITIDDLLEHKIIQLPYEIDSRSFVTCSIGKSCYLLPIRKKYFEYFTIEDLCDCLSIEMRDEKPIEVRLKMPVRGGVIEFRRTYQEEDIVNLNLNIAITPFYRLESETYHMFSSKDRQVRILVGNTETQTFVNGVTYTQRCSYNNSEVGGYTIRDAWDFISIVSQTSDSYENIEGILIPKLMKGNEPREECIFCVDMSDNYTTIMHKGRHEQLAHMLYLDDTEHFLGILCPKDMAFKSQMNSHFIGPPLSNRLNSSLKNLLNVSHDVSHNPRNGRFLENYNILFEYSGSPKGDESIIAPSLHNLNNRGIEFLRIYFEGLLFIMKQEAIWKYNSPSFDLRVAVPPYLCAAERDRFEQVVREAHHASGTNYCNDTMFISGSAANAVFTHFSIGLPEDYVNINIDLMHTHISHCDNNRRIRTLCIDMGIGDLVQNTMSIHPYDKGIEHRIVHQYLCGVGIYSPYKVQFWESLLEYYNLSLIDVFENDMDTDELSHVLNNCKLGDCIQRIETIFLIGLFYYLGRYLDRMGLSRPHAIAFSGLGSKYIQLCFRHIMDIEILFDRIMHVVQRDNYVPGDTKVLFNDNPTQVISQGLHLDGMSVEETFDLFYGLEGNINESVLHYDDVKGMDVLDCMSRSFQIFLDILRSNEISDVLACDLYINLGLVLNNIDTLVNMGEKSMYLCLNEYLQVTQPSNRCDKALFFWSLKHSLYEWLKENC